MMGISQKPLRRPKFPSAPDAAALKTAPSGIHRAREDSEIDEESSNGTHTRGARFVSPRSYLPFSWRSQWQPGRPSPPLMQVRPTFHSIRFIILSFTSLSCVPSMAATHRHRPS